MKERSGWALPIVMGVLASSVDEVFMAITSLSPNPIAPGAELTIAPGPFPAFNPLLHSVVLVSGAIEIPFTSINAWQPSQIRAVVPVVAAGNYQVRTKIGLATDQTSSINLTVSAVTGGTAVLFVAAPQPAVWGAQLLLTAIAGDFGPQREVSIDRSGTSTKLAIRSWSTKQIAATLPAQAPAGDGPYTVVVHKETETAQGTVAITTIGALGANPPLPLLLAATPNPASPGKRVLLTSVGATFGTTPGTVKLTRPSAADVPLVVTTWTPTEIAVVLPATVAPATDYSIVVTTASTTVTAPLAVVATAASTFRPVLPNLPNDPLMGLFGDTRFLQASRLLGDAARMGGKFRYEHLKALAVEAASRVRGFEGQILTLMQMAASKVETAQLLTSPILVQSLNALRADVQSLTDLTTSADVESIMQEVAETTGRALLLEALLLWFIEHDVIEFWIGLFEAICGDIVHADANGTRIKAYLDAQFTTGPFANQLQDVVKALRSRLEAEVDAMAAPIRQAVKSVVANTSRAMEEVFQAIEPPLLMDLARTAGQPDVPNVNPLANVSNQLLSTVEQVIKRLKQKLADLINAPLALFRDVMFAFVVLPILALLAIGLVAGPFLAWLFVAIILIAIEELVHLLIQWLAGPLLKEVDKIKKQAFETLGKLQALLAREASLLEHTSPADLLKLLASELRELKALVPQPFLEAIASLLASARDVVLKDALLLAHGAQAALGAENATAFDALPYGYSSDLPPAPQLPGGTDRGMFAAEALLRDIGKLEQQRTAIFDGKELEITQRVSIQDLLEGDRSRFLEFLRTGRLLLNLSEEGLLDNRFPGLYRALIKEVRVAGLFDASAPIGSAVGLPVTLTHLGPSSTRVKKGANPAAPPITVPDCLGSRDVFVGRILTNPRAPQRSLREIMVDASEYAKRTPIQWPFPTPIPSPYLAVSTLSLYAAFAAYAPAAIAEAVVLASCGVVDPEPVRQAARAILTQQLFSFQRDPFAIFFAFPITQAMIDSNVDSVVRVLRNGITRTKHDRSPIGHIEGLHHTDYDAQEPVHVGDRVLDDAYDRSRGAFEDRIGKWGGAVLRPDRDPQITALGFATLERDAPAETAAYNLVPALGAPSTTAIGPAPTSFDGAPVGHAATIQYRPFENRGLGSRFLVSLPAVDPTGQLAGLTEGAVGLSLANTPLPLLLDLILEVTYRACHDENLAAAVRASGARRRDELKIAQGSNAPIVTIGAPLRPRVAQLRTMHFSLRAHRDRTLLAWKAAKADNGGTIAGLPIDPDVTNVLGLTEPYLPLSSAGGAIVFSLLPSTTLSLSALEGTLPVTLGHLGLPPTALDAALADAERLKPQITQIGFAVIPMPGHATNVRLSSIAGLNSVIPVAANTPLRTIQMFTSTSSLPSPIDLGALDAAGFTINLNLPSPLTSTNAPIYDVIVSMSMRIPALEASVI